LHITIHILILLDACSDGSYGIAHENRKYFAEPSTDEIFLLKSGFWQLQFIVDQLRPFIGIHLQETSEREDETQLQTLQKTFEPVLLLDLLDLSQAILVFSEVGIYVK
jgi:hypothetical protein